MGLWRPATKIRFWTPKTKQSPGVRPPGLLSLFSVLCILSVIGTLVYSVFRTIGTGYDPEPPEALIVAVTHFLLPIAIAYSVFTNSHLSRPLILIYSVALALSLFFGFGYIVPVLNVGLLSGIVVFGALVLIVVWLFASPKMRIYYALLRGRPLPQRLAKRAIEHVENPWPGRKATEVLEWITDHLETIVLVGLIATVVLAWIGMKPR